MSRTLLERLIRKGIKNAIEGRITHIFLPEENSLLSIHWLLEMLHVYGEILKKISLNFFETFSEINDFLYSLVVVEKVTNNVIIILHQHMNVVDPAGMLCCLTHD